MDGRVDVVIPAYNAGRFIDAALDSVAAQGESLARIIVVDDGSTDDTWDRIQAFRMRRADVRVTSVRQTNAGPSAARNRGLFIASSEFVALLDADDIWKHDKLARQLALFDRPRFPNLGVVYCDFSLVSESGEPLPNLGFRLDQRVMGNVYKRLQKGNLIAGSASAALIRRSSLEKVGFFDERLVWGEDWDLWLRLARWYSFDYDKGQLVVIRLHTCNAQKNEARMLGGELLFLDKLYRAGQLKWYHLWRLQRGLAIGPYSAFTLAGFDSCHPRLRAAVTGWRMRLIKATLRNISRLKSAPRAIARRIWRRKKIAN